MFKKLVLIAAFFISIETQAVPIEAKIWKQTKKVISIYSKAMATVYLLTTLIELDIFLNFKYQNKTLRWEMAIMNKILPAEILETLGNRFGSAVINYTQKQNPQEEDILIFNKLCKASKAYIIDHAFSSLKWLSVSLFIDYFNKENKDQDSIQNNNDERSFSIFEYLI